MKNGNCLFCHSALHCHIYIIINEIVSKYTKALFYANYVPANVGKNQKGVNKNDISIRNNGIGRGLGQSSQ